MGMSGFLTSLVQVLAPLLLCETRRQDDHDDAGQRDPVRLDLRHCFFSWSAQRFAPELPGRQEAAIPDGSPGSLIIVAARSVPGACWAACSRGVSSTTPSISSTVRPRSDRNRLSLMPVRIVVLVDYVARLRVCRQAHSDNAGRELGDGLTLLLRPPSPPDAPSFVARLVTTTSQSAAHERSHRQPWSPPMRMGR